MAALLAWPPLAVAASGAAARNGWRDAVLGLGLLMLAVAFVAVLVTTFRHRRHQRRDPAGALFHRHAAVELAWTLVPWLAVAAVAAIAAWIAWA